MYGRMYVNIEYLNILYTNHVVIQLPSYEHVEHVYLLTQETSAPFMNSSISIGVAVAVPAIAVYILVVVVALVLPVCVCACVLWCMENAAAAPATSPATNVNTAVLALATATAPVYLFLIQLPSRQIHSLQIITLANTHTHTVAYKQIQANKQMSAFKKS